MLNISKNLQNQLNWVPLYEMVTEQNLKKSSPVLMSHFIINKTYSIDSKQLCQIKTTI